MADSLVPPERRSRKRPPPLPAIDTQRCTGCGRCIAACDPHVLSFEVVRWKKFAVLHDVPGCTGCRQCAVVCPFDAITMRAAD